MTVLLLPHHIFNTHQRYIYSSFSCQCIIEVVLQARKSGKMKKGQIVHILHSNCLIMWPKSNLASCLRFANFFKSLVMNAYHILTFVFYFSNVVLPLGTFNLILFSFSLLYNLAYMFLSLIHDTAFFYCESVTGKPSLHYGHMS